MTFPSNKPTRNIGNVTGDNRLVDKTKQQVTSQTPNNIDPCTSPLPNNDTHEDATTMEWPTNFFDIVQQLSAVKTTAKPTSVFHFEVTDSAASHNANILRQFKSLQAALLADKQSITGYGSEFKDVNTLQRLFHLHPLWLRMKNILSNGIVFPLDHLPPSIQNQDKLAAISFGNHKGTAINTKFFDDLTHTDVVNGYAIILPFQFLTKLDNVMFCPMNVIQQDTISAEGEIIPKQRACHDLSYKFPPSNTSVNSRVRKEDLQQCMFGHCFRRIIHYIVATRSKYPTTAILIQKTDWKSAYRRAHMNARSALLCCTRYKNFGIIPLRAVFGGSPCPSEWSILSEMTTDLANSILNADNWDTEILYSELSNRLKPVKYLPTTVPFAAAKTLLVDVPLNAVGMCDVYIDDMITVIADANNNRQRAEKAVPLAIKIVGRPLSPSEKIPRSPLPCLKKLEAEGSLEEVKTILGWVINTRSLLINLPKEKYIAWSKSITNILQKGSSNKKELETLIGRLNHIGTIITHALHFLSRLRNLLASAHKRRSVKLREVHVADLHLFLSFLKKSYQGLDMNTITFRLPTHVYFADACPHGLGGYSCQGFAWRFKIPTKLLGRASINMLEHMASTIGPWIDIINNRLRPSSCVLSMTDNTTSAGWLRKSNFTPSNEHPATTEAKLRIARSHAKRMIKFNMREYSQWFPGHKNIVADSLSRDFHVTNTDLVSKFNKHFAPQIPPHFNIYALPREIECWICALLQRLPEQQQSLEAHHSSNFELGNAGNPSSNQLIFPRIYSSTNSNATNEQRLYQHSLMHIEEQSFLNENFLNWVREQSDVPWTMWHRPLGSTNVKIHGSTQTRSLRDFYSSNFKAIETKIHHPTVKKHSQLASSSN